MNTLSTSRARRKVGIFSAGIADAVAIARFNLDTHGVANKFLDPWMVQNVGASWLTWPKGREYLDGVPSNGLARVDAMLAKVAGPAGDREVFGTDALAVLGEVLRQRIDAEALQTRAAVWQYWDRIASTAGANFWVYLAAQGMKFLTSRFDLSAYGASAKAKALASGNVGLILESFGDNVTSGMAYPWHALDLLYMIDVHRLNESLTKMTKAQTDAAKTGSPAPAPDSPGKVGAEATASASTLTVGFSEFIDTASQIAEEVSSDKAAIARLDLVAQVLTSNRKKNASLAPNLQAASSAWMALCVSRLRDPGVRRVWNAMHGDEWGANGLASDEQVLAVAAPIALDFGLPLRDFAARLWEESPGWSGFPAALDNTGFLSSGAWGAGSGGSDSTPTNAAQVQFAVLAARGFAIAKDMGGVSSSAPEGGGGSIGVTEVAIGAGALGLLAWLFL